MPPDLIQFLENGKYPIKTLLIDIVLLPSVEHLLELDPVLMEREVERQMERVGIFKMNFTLKLKRIKKEMHKPASLIT